ncbi:hypothetical protein EYC80_008200 [Monilinia laxa]|uniref:Uncharacterized protein n=1 Tax=Monilinia laxa TaxID=61186 RepID=A0A5N6JTU2_MONLA|nr:hypothetical protein EYC80_008200 [Monilinia laxa]
MIDTTHRSVQQARLLLYDRFKMEGVMEGPYFFQEQDRTQYPPIPQENADEFALGSHCVDQYTRLFHKKMAQNPHLSNINHNPVQQYPARVALTYDQPQPYLAPFAQYANQFEEDPPTTQHSLSPQHDLPATPLQHDNGVNESKHDVIIKEEVIDDEPIQQGPAEDDNVNQEPATADVEAPIAFPENVTPQELRYSTKQLRDKNMSIFHRKEFAYCEVAMTVEEHFQIKGLNHVTPQTFSMPDKNGKYQKRKRIRITWAERDVLNAWRVRNNIKPHEIRPGSKYAAARDYWRLHAPHVVKPRKTIEWSLSRGPVPAP